MVLDQALINFQVVFRLNQGILPQSVDQHLERLNEISSIFPKITQGQTDIEKKSSQKLLILIASQWTNQELKKPN